MARLNGEASLGCCGFNMVLKGSFLREAHIWQVYTEKGLSGYRVSFFNNEMEEYSSELFKTFEKATFAVQEEDLRIQKAIEAIQYNK